jgi:hypothetical protein
LPLGFFIGGFIDEGGFIGFIGFFGFLATSYSPVR